MFWSVMGPIQKGLSVEEATEVVAYALESGITFVILHRCIKHMRL